MRFRFVASCLAVSVALLGSNARAQVSGDPGVSKQEPVVYDFKGAKLGMTLEDWMAMPYPSPNAGVALLHPIPACSSNNPVGMNLYREREEEELGVVLCSYGTRNTSKYEDPWTRQPVIIGSLAAKVVYRFIEGRLFRIDIDGPLGMQGDVFEGLNAKFGPVSDSVNDTVQNGLGATFPRTISRWTNPKASIIVIAPSARTDTMHVTYYDNDSFERVAARKRADHPASGKM